MTSRTCVSIARSQLDRWAEQIGGYLRAGLIVYGYFNNHYQGHSPASVRATADATGRRR